MAHDNSKLIDHSDPQQDSNDVEQDVNQRRLKSGPGASDCRNYSRNACADVRAKGQGNPRFEGNQSLTCHRNCNTGRG